jgi:hypothetical protein
MKPNCRRFASPTVSETVSESTGKLRRIVASSGEFSFDILGFSLFCQQSESLIQSEPCLWSHLTKSLVDNDCFGWEALKNGKKQPSV